MVLHVTRNAEYRDGYRRVSWAEVSGTRVRGTPRLGWIYSVKVNFSCRGMTVEAA